MEMNSHLLPYPYNHARSPFPSILNLYYESLIKVLYSIYLQLQPPTASSSVPNPIRVVCISDTHNATPQLLDGDLLIHAGDLTQDGSCEELRSQIRWLSTLPHNHKVVIAGNHDLVLDSDFMRHYPTRLSSESSVPTLDWGDIIYLQDTSVTLEFPNGRKLKIYGSPRTPEFGVWAFQYPAIRDVWTKRIPDDVDVVIVHGPPVMYCDANRKGDGYLLRELRRVKPQLVVFGHIHDGYGQEILLHDGMQSAREDVILRRSGFLAILRMIMWMTLAWFRVLLGLQQPNFTRLINAAVTPGAKSKDKKKPIVLEI